MVYFECADLDVRVAWSFDGGVRRETVRDPNWGNRVIRRMGWRTCMHYNAWFFSPAIDPDSSQQTMTGPFATGSLPVICRHMA